MSRYSNYYQQKFFENCVRNGENGTSISSSCEILKEHITLNELKELFNRSALLNYLTDKVRVIACYRETTDISYYALVPNAELEPQFEIERLFIVQSKYDLLYQLLTCGHVDDKRIFTTLVIFVYEKMDERLDDDTTEAQPVVMTVDEIIEYLLAAMDTDICNGKRNKTFVSYKKMTVATPKL